MDTCVGMGAGAGKDEGEGAGMSYWGQIRDGHGVARRGGSGRVGVHV